MRRQIAYGVAAMTYGKGVTAAVQLALVPILAVAWGLPLYGQWLILSSIPVFLGASDFGFGTAAGNRIIGETARSNFAAALTTFQSAWLLVVLASLAMAAVAVGATFALPDGLLEVNDGLPAAQARDVLLVLIAYGLVSLQGLLFTAVARGQGRQGLSITVDATIQLAEGLAVVGLVLAGFGPMAAALGLLGVRCCGVAIHAWLAHRLADWLVLGFARGNRDCLRELLRPALAAMVLPLAQAGYLQGSAMAVGAAAGAAAVPLLTSLRTLSRLGLQLVTTLALPLMPVYTAAHANANSERLARLGGGLAIASLAIGIAFSLGIGLFGMETLRIWTGGTIQPPQAMVVLTAIGLLPGLVWNPLSTLLLAINRHEAYSYTYLAMAVCTAGLTYALVHRFGVTGAAGANLVLEAVMLVTVLVSLRRHAGPLAFGRETFRAVLPQRWRGRLFGG